MRVAVAGSGSWGTALAKVLADAGSEVVILSRQEDKARSIVEEHRNPAYLSDYVLPDTVSATVDPAAALAGAGACVLVTPSRFMRESVLKLADLIDPDLPLVVCTKGVEAGSGLLMSQVVADVCGNERRIAVLSGPTHAEEVIRGIPSGAVVASTDTRTARFFQALFATERFRTYTTDDVIGVELCAAFKNVIAIAVGISYGMGFGDDTAAMLITRGLAEMRRMVVACGGKTVTCLGLAGAGDMVVTCMSRHSRNRRFGEDYVAHGRTLADFERDTHMVVEGAVACQTLEVLACRHGIELPITDSIRNVIWKGADLDAEARLLVSRSLKDEFADL